MNVRRLFFFVIYNLFSLRIRFPSFCTFISKLKESQLRMNVCIIMYEISRRRSAERRLEKVRGRAGVKAAAIHSSSSSSHSSSSSSASSSSSYPFTHFPFSQLWVLYFATKNTKSFHRFWLVIKSKNRELIGSNGGPGRSRNSPFHLQAENPSLPDVVAVEWDSR